MNKQELLDLLRICNADATAIEAVELAYDIGYEAGTCSRSRKERRR